MKPPLPRTLSAVPRTLHVQLEIAKAIHALTSQDEVERLRRRDGNPPVGKAAADDPDHPGWPAGTSGGKGGQFRPKDSAEMLPIVKPKQGAMCSRLLQLRDD
jgi:hypothetical protein